LPRFFIDRLTDPARSSTTRSRRGTTPLGRPSRDGCRSRDINPLSQMLLQRDSARRPSMSAPWLDALTSTGVRAPLAWAFFHPETLSAIAALRHYDRARASGAIDGVDRWIRWSPSTA
jgi:hypothetical protein